MNNQLLDTQEHFDEYQKPQLLDTQEHFDEYQKLGEPAQ